MRCFVCTVANKRNQTSRAAIYSGRKQAVAYIIRNRYF